MKASKLLLSIFLVTFSCSLPGQTPLIDSLKTELSNDHPTEEYSRLLRTIAGELRFVDVKEALIYARDNVAFCEKNKDDELLFKAYYTLGSCYLDNYQLDSAQFASQLALQYVQKIDNRFFESFVLNLLGIISDNQNKPDAAIDYYFQSVKIGEELKDTATIYYAYANIGVLYFERNDLKNCVKYLTYSVDLSEAAGDEEHLAMSLLNLNSCYQSESQQANKLSLLNRAYALAEKNNRLDILTSICSNMGALYHDGFKDYDNAEKYYRQGIQLANQVGDINRKCVLYNNIGNNFFMQGNTDSAFWYIEKALDLAKELNDFEEIYDANEYLSNIHYKQGDYRVAYDYYKKAVEARDSMFLEDKNEALAEADAKYQNERKEKELVSKDLELSQQASFINRLIVIALVIIMGLLAFFQWYYFQQRKKKRQTEMKLQLQEMEATQLRELDRTKSRFFANLSHELRTPLTLILGPLKNALESGKQHPLKKDLELAKNNSHKLLQLVNEIMDLSKLESGKLALYPSNIFIIPHLKRIFMAYESAANTRNIELSFSNNLSESTTLRIDAAKVEKIVDNLISNALKFSTNGGEIKMSISKKDDQLCIAVSDQGIGIPTADLPHLFDRFYQSNNQGEALQGGTGIGLALAKELALLHEGNISVESEENKGSTFTLLLPFEEVSTITKVEPSEQEVTFENPYSAGVYQALLLNNEKARVLVVEDNPEMRQFIQEILSPYFYCLTANDGAEGLKVLEQSKIDLVISDVMMPNMDGFTFREKVNQHPQFKYLPFIMLTARAEEDDKIKGLQMGVDDYIAKPFGTRELIARVHNLLKNKIEREEALKEDPVLANEEKETADERFIREVEQSILKHLDEVEYKVSDLAKEVGYSQRQLSRVLKRITGMNPVGFILELRLQKAYQLIMQQRYLTVSEVRYDVGIDSASYFSKKFTERFGESPSNLLKQV